MKITQASFTGFKRLALANIKELELEFPNPITVIRGISGVGKSSILQELSPLPSIRTQYERDGRKELVIQHEKHEYVLVSDFSNRTSPHSFCMDGQELNTGHTSAVQEELVIRHFGYTPTIRNLVYCKTRMCALTKSERKNLFLSINPIDFSLVSDVFKASQGKYRDCKAQLQLLYSRKAELESKMLPDEVLARHLNTQHELNEESLDLDKAIYQLEQEIQRFSRERTDDLKYYNQCIERGFELVPCERIIAECNTIRSRLDRYSDIPRGDRFLTARNRLYTEVAQVSTSVDNLKQSVSSLSDEINEYHHQLEQAQGRPISAIEQDIKILDEQLSVFHDLPSNPVPPSRWAEYQDRMTSIRDLVFIFRDAEVKMIDPDEIRKWIHTKEQLTNQLNACNYSIASLVKHRDQALADYDELVKTTNVPAACNVPTCVLRAGIDARKQDIMTRLAQYDRDLHDALQTKESLDAGIAEVGAKVAPYLDHDLLGHYHRLLSQLHYQYFQLEDWDSTLVERLRTQPVLILKQLDAHLVGSQSANEYNRLMEMKKQLLVELDVLVKSSGVSVDFFKTKLTEKERLIRDQLAELSSLETKLAVLQHTSQLYDDYGTDLNKINALLDRFDKGQRALLTHATIDFLKDNVRQARERKLSISAKLREIDNIVQEQQMLKHTYQSENLNLITGIDRDMNYYQLISSALSPNSGIPHKSMVRYMNALITNVNTFISQIWTYRLKVSELDIQQPIDYELLAEVGSYNSTSIDSLSEGQTEVMNLSWMLTILLQMGVLKHIPLMLDEAGRALDPIHRMKLLNFFNQLINNHYVEQMFLVSHYEEFAHGFTTSNIVQITTNDAELESGANATVRITRY